MSCSEYEQIVKNSDEHHPLPPFAEWLQTAASPYLDLHPDADQDISLFSMLPKRRAASHDKMFAYGNHYRVKDETTHMMVTYESGLLLTAIDHSGARIADPFIGELVQILRVDYGPTRLPIVLFRGKWVRPQTSRKPSSFKADSDGFTCANFKQLLPLDEDPYVFPSVAQQVFFMREPQPSGWRVVLRKEPRGRRIFLDLENDV